MSAVPTTAIPTTAGEVPATGTETTTTIPGDTPTTAAPANPNGAGANPACVVEVVAGDSLGVIADRFDDDTVLAGSIMTENGLADDEIHPGDLLDVCVANGINDITGAQRADADPNADPATGTTVNTTPDTIALSSQTGVRAQQGHLNALFANKGISPLLVDGISGKVTRQRLCAARVALGLPVSLADMTAGSEEEVALMAATALPLPYTTALLSERWILIDQTCQIMFVGTGPTELNFVFPTSTGQPQFPTRLQDRSKVFKYDPALANGGWHNSSSYPAAEDNPLNGNMYKPLYFDRGQAIHGANNVPTDPQSHGCARLRVEHQDQLVAWLGLAEVPGVVTSRNQINVTVNIQGDYVPAA